MSDTEHGVVYSVDVTVTAPVQPTEVTDRVVQAVTGLFPNADVETRGNRVVAEAHDVETLREQLFEQRILDTARKEFHRNQTDQGFSFDLKKQAAFVGKVNFSVGSPDELGDIHVEVDVHEPDVESFIGYLAPKTQDGEPVESPE
ncbi:MAG: RNA-binding domain-containing protein [Halobacterium sp.]